MSEVFFKRISSQQLLKEPSQLVFCAKEAGLFRYFKRGSLLALKLHFGEKGNTSYIKPDYLLALVHFLKKEGLKPFLFETTTLYRGERMNAIDHINLAYGHGFMKLGLPIIIGDGIRGNDDYEVVINKKNFRVCYLARALKDIENILVLSHFTGHMLTGFGGALKNLGMGCASRKGKFAQHSQVSPQIIKEKCIACGLCSQSCPVLAITKDKFDRYVILAEKCIGCAQCISVCPKGAVKINWSEAYNLIMERLVEYACAVVEKRKCAYINFCLYITKECDCMNKEKRGIIEDIGVLFSFDPVSIDKAAVDLVCTQDKDLLSKLHPRIDYLYQLRYAQGLGLGSLEYKLIEL